MPDFLFLSNADTGGQCIAFTKAINRYTSYSARFLRMSANYIDYPYDLCAQYGHYSLLDGKFYSRDDIIELVKDSEILVFDVYDRYYGWDILFEDYYKGKRCVYIQNGDQLRDNSQLANHFFGENDDAIIVSTPDLLNAILSVKKKIWIPNIVVDEDFLETRLVRSYSNPLIIGHSPTNPRRKGTFMFIRALGELAKEYPVTFDPIAFMPWYKCIGYRAMNHHVLFDQITEDIEWYGVCSIESAWMGQPVIVNKLLPIDAGDPPFLQVTSRNLKGDLRKALEVLCDENGYYDLAIRHQQWAKEFHDPKKRAEERAKWMMENATEWRKDHGFFTDKELLMKGWKWEKGRGVRLW